MYLRTKSSPQQMTWSSNAQSKVKLNTCGDVPFQAGTRLLPKLAIMLLGQEKNVVTGSGATPKVTCPCWIGCMLCVGALLGGRQLAVGAAVGAQRHHRRRVGVRRARRLRLLQEQLQHDLRK